MWADHIIKDNPFSNFFVGDKTIAHILEVNIFTFVAVPQQINKDIIQIWSPAIHGYFETSIPQAIIPAIRGHGIFYYLDNYITIRYVPYCN